MHHSFQSAEICLYIQSLHILQCLYMIQLLRIFLVYFSWIKLQLHSPKELRNLIRNLDHFCPEEKKMRVQYLSFMEAVHNINDTSKYWCHTYLGFGDAWAGWWWGDTATLGQCSQPLRPKLQSRLWHLDTPSRLGRRGLSLALQLLGEKYTKSR